MKLTKELLKRQSKFWSYVDIKTKDECWEWLKCCMSSGYGQFSIGTKDIGSHRFALLLTKKTLDDNLVVMHTCDNKKCCNPNHLVEGTTKQNALDASAKGLLPQLKGERHGKSKLTEKSVKEIRSLRLKGLTIKAIAEKMNVSKGCVGDILSRRRWGWLQ